MRVPRGSVPEKARVRSLPKARRAGPSTLAALSDERAPPSDEQPPAGKRPHDDDRFEPAPQKDRHGRLQAPQMSTKMLALGEWAQVFGVEVGVRVQYVDPLNDRRTKNLKLNWIGGSDMAALDVESVFWRKELGGGRRLELQGPALQGRGDGESSPLRARFVGLALSSEMTADAPGDAHPPKVEAKLEVRLTDRSVVALAALAGSADELAGIGEKLAGTGVVDVIGNALLGAVPVVAGGIALVSARRALKVVRDHAASKAAKALAVVRAVADAVTVVAPLVGTLANIGIVATAAGIAKLRAKRAGQHPPTGPPPSTPASPAAIPDSEG